MLHITQRAAFKRGEKLLSLLLAFIMLIVMVFSDNSTIVSNAKSKGWQKVGSRNYYINSDGSYPKGQKKINNKKYIFTDEGYRVTTDNITKGIGKASGSRSVKGFGDYKMSSKVKRNIQKQVNSLRSSGYDVGFLLYDPVTGQGVSYNCDRYFYSASSVKGPYVVSIVSNNSAVLRREYNSISAVLHYSDNGRYSYLWNKYGRSPMRNWYKKSNASGNTQRMYTNYSARTLAKLWASNLMYFNSCKTGEKLGKMFESPNISTIHRTLGSKYTTRTKAGWIGYPRTKSATDGGIVYKGSNGNRPVIMAVLSNLPGTHVRLNGLVSAVNAAHDEMMKKEKSLIKVKKKSFTSSTAKWEHTFKGLRLRIKKGGFAPKGWIKMDSVYYLMNSHGFVRVRYKDGKYYKYNIAGKNWKEIHVEPGSELAHPSDTGQEVPTATSTDSTSDFSTDSSSGS